MDNIQELKVKYPDEDDGGELFAKPVKKKKQRTQNTFPNRLMGESFADWMARLGSEPTSRAHVEPIIGNTIITSYVFDEAVEHDEPTEQF